MNISNTNLIYGIYINNIDVSNMSNNEVKEYFNTILDKKKI